MLNSIYHFEKMRDVLNEFEPSRELSLAKTKLEECELWLTKCHPTKEAVERDMAAPAPDSTEEGPEFDWPVRARNAHNPSRLEYVNEDTLMKVFEALVGADGGFQLSGDHAREAITAMQTAGILFRERMK
jgi:hypothetical protein